MNIAPTRFRKKRPGEISLEDTFDTDDEFRAPGKQIGRVDLNLTGLIDRIGLSRAIDQLPAGCRKMFMLHDVEGYGHEEIAKILGCSVGNSKSQLHKARMRLRRLLQDQRRTFEQNEAGFLHPLGAAGGLVRDARSATKVLHRDVMDSCNRGLAVGHSPGRTCSCVQG